MKQRGAALPGRDLFHRRRSMQFHGCHQPACDGQAQGVSVRPHAAAGAEGRLHMLAQAVAHARPQVFGRGLGQDFRIDKGVNRRMLQMEEPAE